MWIAAPSSMRKPLIRETCSAARTAGDVRRHRDDEGDEDRGEQEPVGVLPRRQAKDVERQVVMEDRVAHAEGHAVQGARIDHPGAGRRAGGAWMVYARALDGVPFGA